MLETERRIPSLDGIRGVLLLIVLTAHLLGTKYFPISREALPMDGIAYNAMRVFFAISGFLITGILLRELKRRGTINLLRFYFKRTFRIFPAYYTFLIAVAILSLTGFITLRPGDMAHAVTYTSNYNVGPAWQLGHTWSLSVEEQFYLLWPLLLLLLGLHRMVWGLAGLMIAMPIWRFFLQAVPPDAFGLGPFQHGMSHTFDTTADAIAAGCLLAILRDQLWAWAPYRRLLESRVMLLVFAYIILAAFARDAADLFTGSTRLAILTANELIGIPAVNISIALMIDWAMRNPHGRFGRVLNTPFLMRLGVISYSAYLWQQIFLNRHETHLINVFPLNVVLALGCAYLSFHLVEMPMLAARERIDARRMQRVEPARAAPTPGAGCRGSVAGSDRVKSGNASITDTSTSRHQQVTARTALTD